LGLTIQNEMPNSKAKAKTAIQQFKNKRKIINTWDLQYKLL
jgi:hypothetical protein